VIGRLSPQAGKKIREASRDISGVNETVASGLSLPLARPWLLVVPVLLDLFLWLGMQVPINRMTDPLAREMLARGGDNGELAADQIHLLGESFRLNDVVGSMLPSVFAGLSHDNLFNLMWATFAPGLASGIDRGDLADIWHNALGSISDPGSIGGIIGLGVVFFLISTLITVAWRVPLALAMANRRMPPLDIVRYIVRAWVRFVALIALVSFAGLVILVPVLIVAAVLLLVQVDLAALVSIFLVMLGSVIAIYARFVLESIIVNDIGPIRALKRSALISQTFFGATVRFSIVAALVASGALRLWDTMIPSPPGLPVAIVVNSFLGTGIAIASMMFYYDRDRLIQKFAPARSTPDHTQTPL
jgi:hypothetical protein